MHRILMPGDAVVFDFVSRMSRNVEEGFALYEELYRSGVELVFLKEHHIDTENYKKALSGSIAIRITPATMPSRVWRRHQRISRIPCWGSI